MSRTRESSTTSPPFYLTKDYCEAIEMGSKKERINAMLERITNLLMIVEEGEYQEGNTKLKIDIKSGSQLQQADLRHNEELISEGFIQYHLMLWEENEWTNSLTCWLDLEDRQNPYKRMVFDYPELQDTDFSETQWIAWDTDLITDRLSYLTLEKFIKVLERLERNTQPHFSDTSPEAAEKRRTRREALGMQ